MKPREWLFMDEHWGMPERTAEVFFNGWLLTDDLAHRDEDSYFWYEGRSDDVIISSGNRIGSFEVENSLMEHPIIAEAMVIGVPDDQRGQIVKAYVVPTETPEAPECTLDGLQSHVKSQLARPAYPRGIEFIDELPTNATGKVQRYRLEERERT